MCHCDCRLDMISSLHIRSRRLTLKGAACDSAVLPWSWKSRPPQVSEDATTTPMQYDTSPMPVLSPGPWAPANPRRRLRRGRIRAASTARGNRHSRFTSRRAYRPASGPRGPGVLQFPIPRHEAARAMCCWYGAVPPVAPSRRPLHRAPCALCCGVLTMGVTRRSLLFFAQLPGAALCCTRSGLLQIVLVVVVSGRCRCYWKPSIVRRFS
jgi:hypothetical protein